MWQVFWKILLLFEGGLLSTLLVEFLNLGDCDYLVSMDFVQRQFLLFFCVWYFLYSWDTYLNSCNSLGKWSRSGQFSQGNLWQVLRQYYYWNRRIQCANLSQFVDTKLNQFFKFLISCRFLKECRMWRAASQVWKIVNSIQWLRCLMWRCHSFTRT